MRKLKMGLLKRTAFHAILTVLTAGLAVHTAAAAEAAAITHETGLASIKIQSVILGQPMWANVFLPKGYDKTQKYPVLYAFHGFGSNESSWMPTRRADTIAGALLAEGKIRPYIIVAPGMNNSWGMNTSARSEQVQSPNGAVYHIGMYEDYFIKELIPHIEKTYSVATDARGRYIAGVSMGGYAAAHFALKYPTLFSKVGLHSPALRMPEEWSDPLSRELFFPTPQFVTANHPVPLAQATNDFKGMRFYIDCGEQDSLFPTARAFHDLLVSKGAQAEFHSGPGPHGNAYTNPRIQDYLLFFGQP